MRGKKSHIAYEQSHHFSKLIIDYLSAKESLKNLYDDLPTMEGFENKIAKRSNVQTNRHLLVDVITKQYKDAGLDIPESLSLLVSENTFTITTGHQLCLFTGPLYFIYKIVTAINLAKELKAKFPAFNFVPVYWMAGEDHDFEEVNHVFLSEKKIIWEASQDANTPVGKINLQGISQVVDEIKSTLGSKPYGNEIIAFLVKHYSETNNLTQATRAFVNEIFEGSDLLILDPDDAQLKKQFSDVTEHDCFQNEAFKKLNEYNLQLELQGYKVQVQPREINSFYMTAKARQRIIKEGNLFKINNTSLSFTEDELKAELKNFPERFSPNVVLRPLYQEKILPNIAYVGGGGEVAYWLQLKSIFDHYSLSFPILILRNSLLFIEQSLEKKIMKLGLSDADLFKTSDDLVKKYVSELAGDEIILSAEAAELKTLYSNLSQKIQQVDTTLKATVEAELQKALGGIKMLEAKLMKAQKLKQENAVNQIQKLKAKLFPSEGLQERHDNFMQYYALYGRDFIALLLNELKPLDFNFTILKAAQ